MNLTVKKSVQPEFQVQLELRVPEHLGWQQEYMRILREGLLQPKGFGVSYG